jgi:hypothetical protein
MREKIDTIPINDAFDSGDECPFCFLEREAEQRAIKYTIGPGASYMEPEIRAITDREGFCRHHFKMMYEYKNALGCALIMQTYYTGVLMELEEKLENYELPPKKGFFRKKTAEQGENPLITWMQEKQSSCFVCRQMEENMQRYFDTFFAMLKDPEFREKVEGSKGFCMHHFLELMEQAADSLPNSQRDWFREKIPALMRENLLRMKADLDRFVMKNDYRNASLPWENAMDAVPRGMQKLQGGHPADSVFRNADYGLKR